MAWRRSGVRIPIAPLSRPTGSSGGLSRFPPRPCRPPTEGVPPGGGNAGNIHQRSLRARLGGPHSRKDRGHPHGGRAGGCAGDPSRRRLLICHRSVVRGVSGIRAYRWRSHIAGHGAVGETLRSLDHPARKAADPSGHGETAAAVSGGEYQRGPLAGHRLSRVVRTRGGGRPRKARIPWRGGRG